MAEKQTPMIAVSTPMSGEAGTTGTWRTRRPVIHPASCRTCQPTPRDCRICWLYCPEPAIAPGSPPVIDYEHCKGCGICAKECPAGAIDMLPEDSVEPTLSPGVAETSPEHPVGPTPSPGVAERSPERPVGPTPSPGVAERSPERPVGPTPPSAIRTPPSEAVETSPEHSVGPTPSSAVHTRPPGTLDMTDEEQA